MDNTGHGHVRPRPDGAVAKCGGPGLCDECSREAAQLDGNTWMPPLNNPGRTFPNPLKAKVHNKLLAMGRIKE